MALGACSAWACPWMLIIITVHAAVSAGVCFWATDQRHHMWRCDRMTANGQLNPDLSLRTLAQSTLRLRAPDAIDESMCEDAVSSAHGFSALPYHLLSTILATLSLNDLFTVSAACTFLRKAAADVLSDTRMQAVSVARRPVPCLAGRSIEGQYEHNPGQAQGTPVVCSSHSLGYACLRSLLLYVPNLVLLDLRWAFNWIDDTCLKMLGSLCPPSLRHLILQSCARVTEAGLQELCRGPVLQHLETLVLRGCGDIGDGSSLAALSHLRHLDVSWCTSVTSKGLHPVCGQLNVATLRGCDLLDSSLCSELRNAEVVDLSFTRVCNAGLRALVCLPCLKRLALAARTNNIYGTGLYTDSCLEEVIRARPSLVVDLVVA